MITLPPAPGAPCRKALYIADETGAYSSTLTIISSVRIEHRCRSGLDHDGLILSEANLPLKWGAPVDLRMIWIGTVVLMIFALLGALPPAWADQILPAPEVEDATGIVKFRGGPVIGRRLQGTFQDAVALPRISAAVEGGLIADGVTDQRANLLAAAAKIPASGAIMTLPCGQIFLASPTVIPNQNTIVEGGGQFCTTIVSTFTAGDVLTMSGNYSGVRDIGFKQKPPASGSPIRSSGYTLRMAGAYQFAKYVSFQHCYRCIMMAPLAGWARVSDTDMTNITPDSVAAGSGGITVWNPTYGPNNWIDHVLIYGGQDNPSAAPLSGINIVNSGATQISNFDILGFKTNLLVNPGEDTSGFTRNPGGTPTVQTSQALRVSNGYFDSALGSANVLFLPSGAGYIFDSTMVGAWLTNTATVSSNGLEVNTRASTRTDDLAFKGLTFTTGFIVNTGTGGNNGFLCTNGTATAQPSDITISETAIAGWGQGANIGCSDGTLSDNRIGKYSPFGMHKTNNTGIYLNNNIDNWSITGNRLLGNSSDALIDVSTGKSVRITDNLGYNGMRPASTLTVGASPFTLTNGHTPASFYVNGGIVSSIVAPGGNVALASQSPVALQLGPNESVIITYSTAPTIARMPH